MKSLMNGWADGQMGGLTDNTNQVALINDIHRATNLTSPPFFECIINQIICEFTSTFSESKQLKPIYNNLPLFV